MTSRLAPYGVEAWGAQEAAETGEGHGTVVGNLDTVGSGSANRSERTVRGVSAPSPVPQVERRCQDIAEFGEERRRQVRSATDSIGRGDRD